VAGPSTEPVAEPAVAAEEAAPPAKGKGKGKAKAAAPAKAKGKAKPQAKAHPGGSGKIMGMETLRHILGFPIPKSDRWTDEVMSPNYLPLGSVRVSARLTHDVSKWPLVQVRVSLAAADTQRFNSTVAASLVATDTGCALHNVS
jgi:hypothetical protein